MERAKFIVSVEEGIHARPANYLTKTAMAFKSDIKFYKNGNETKTYNPKSILSVISMGAVCGDEITIVAEGIDEEEAVKKLLAFADNGFK